MKKKLEAELISIAHRILKLKNRAELDQLQQETLKLYEKISVLRFVEDNFSEVKPTIGYASAEEKLEEIYGIEEIAPVHGNEQEAKEDERRAEHAKEREGAGQDKVSDSGEGVDTKGSDESPASEEEIEETRATEEEPQAEEKPQATSQEPQATPNPEPETEVQPATADAEGADPGQKIEEYQASEEEKEETAEAEGEESKTGAPQSASETKPETRNPVTGTQGFSFDFDKQPAEEPKKQKEITFEDYRDYKEPEFVKKDDPQSINKEFLPKEPEVAQKQQDNAEAFGNSQPVTPDPEQETPVRDWRDWEPAKSPAADKPKAEEAQATSQQPQADAPTPATQNPQPATQNLRAINLGLNDRIAFEKNLFGGSGEDLNRVLSQLNTMDRFDDARNFINDLVKPDYNNWQGKEEYEERFLQLVEQRFS